MFNTIQYIIHVTLFIIFSLLKTNDPSNTLTSASMASEITKELSGWHFYHNEEEFQTDHPFRNETFHKDTLVDKSFCIQIFRSETSTYGYCSARR